MLNTRRIYVARVLRSIGRASRWRWLYGVVVWWSVSWRMVGLVGSTWAGSPVTRSPVAVALTRNAKWLVVANQGSGTVSCIDADRLRVVGEAAVGDHPTAVAAGRQPDDVWVACRDSGEIVQLRAGAERLDVLRRVRVGFHPWGVAVARRAGELWVTQRASGSVAVIDLAEPDRVEQVEVGPWPEHIVVSPDESRLAVTLAAGKGIALIDRAARRVTRRSFRAYNLGQPLFSRDGREVVVSWMVYRANPITADNIRRGWVWGSRIGRIGVAPDFDRQVLTLDERGRAVADPWGAAWCGPGQGLVITASGTHELLWLAESDRLPWLDYRGSDHMPAGLIRDRGRFRRIALGGRPMGVVYDASRRRLAVANYLLDQLQILAVPTFEPAAAIDLGRPSGPTSARRGEAIFFDARRSLDQWYSCHTCHREGGTNAVIVDTFNDHTSRTYKTITPLYHVRRTGPWTWLGWQHDLRQAMVKSLTSTMLGPDPTDADVEDLLAFLDGLRPPVQPWREVPSAAARRGAAIFHSADRACSSCHAGPYLTDGELHDVGTGNRSDGDAPYNTPSLRHLYLRTRFLHDGRARSLNALLQGPHSPSRVSGARPLTDRERYDLIEYLKRL